MQTEKERENFGYTGWGFSAGETRFQPQSLTALLGRARGGAAQKGNTSCGEKERWQHRYKVDSTFQESTSPDSGGGKQMEAGARFRSQAQHRAQGRGATKAAGMSCRTRGGALRSSGQNGATNGEPPHTSATSATGHQCLQL